MRKNQVPSSLLYWCREEGPLCCIDLHIFFTRLIVQLVIWQIVLLLLLRHFLCLERPIFIIHITFLPDHRQRIEFSRHHLSNISFYTTVALIYWNKSAVRVYKKMTMFGWQTEQNETNLSYLDKEMQYTLRSVSKLAASLHILWMLSQLEPQQWQ